MISALVDEPVDHRRGDDATRWPARQARISSAFEKCVPGAGRAEQDDVLLAGEEVELAEVDDDGL